MSESPVLVRRLTEAEWDGAFPIVAQLRGHLDRAECLARAGRQSRTHGYELIGAFDRSSGALLGILGMRPVLTLARGDHLHIDDVVVAETSRGSGIGRALMAFAEAEARARGLAAVFLDARPEAAAFYDGLGYAPHPATLMHKRL